MVPRLVVVAATEGVFDCRYAFPAASYPVNEVVAFDFSRTCLFGCVWLFLGPKGLSSESSLSVLIWALAISCSILAVLPVPAVEIVCFQHQRCSVPFFRTETDVCVTISHAIVIVTVVISILIAAFFLGSCCRFAQIRIDAQNAALSTTLEIYVFFVATE